MKISTMKLIAVIVLSCLIISCTKSKRKSLPKLTTEQSAATAALSMLQVSTDEPNRLYSTFPNIEQPCYPPDSSFVISQSEFLVALKEFTFNYCALLPGEQRDSLAERSARAQDEYKVLHCSIDSENEDYSYGLPMTGTWVIPNLLERIDVTIIWD